MTDGPVVSEAFLSSSNKYLSGLRTINFSPDFPTSPRIFQKKNMESEVGVELELFKTRQENG